ncbi:hypothetical protein LCGC14_0821920 [marine sediment metagenome]|uniref:Uncharacterized protein n=1 Tax=marine sediment metagenome TaxID=412755 RepID=A0A0F9SR36_9ZZZZ
MCVTEERVKELAREEYQKLLGTEQDVCKHSDRGTLNADGSVTCSACGKVL